MARAIALFWETALTWRPRVVFLSTANSAANTTRQKAMM